MFDLWSPWCHRLLGAVMLLRWQRWKLFLQSSTCQCKNGLNHDRVATQHHLCPWTGVAEEKRSRLSGDYVKLRDIPCPQTRNAIKATIQHLYNICTNILLGRLANPGCIIYQCVFWEAEMNVFSLQTSHRRILIIYINVFQEWEWMKMVDQVFIQMDEPQVIFLRAGSQWTVFCQVALIRPN